MLSELQIALTQRAINTECNLLERLYKENPEQKFYPDQVKELREASDILNEMRIPDFLNPDPKIHKHPFGESVCTICHP